jgi:hypothetical protein
MKMFLPAIKGPSPPIPESDESAISHTQIQTKNSPSHLKNPENLKKFQFSFESTCEMKQGRSAEDLDHLFEISGGRGQLGPNFNVQFNG